MDRLIPIVELSVAEAYAIVTEKLGIDRCTLPPLDAIENEDWGRDLLLSRLAELSDDRLKAVGLCRCEISQTQQASMINARETRSGWFPAPHLEPYS